MRINTVTEQMLSKMDQDILMESVFTSIVPKLSKYIGKYKDRMVKITFKRFSKLRKVIASIIGNKNLMYVERKADKYIPMLEKDPRKIKKVAEDIEEDTKTMGFICYNEINNVILYNWIILRVKERLTCLYLNTL